MSDLRVCLAEYNCRCRPVGKATPFFTMRAHRRRANKSRARYGMPPLPSGPKYTDAASAEQVSLHREMFFRPEEQRSNDVVRTIFHNGHHISLGIGDYSPPSCNFTEQINECSHTAHADETRTLSPNRIPQVPPPLPAPGSDFLDEAEEVPSPLPAPDSDFLDEADDVIAFDESIQLEPFPSSIESPAIDMSDNNGSQSLTLAVISSRSCDEIVKKGEAYYKFMSWAFANNKWISLGIDFGLQRNAMNSILSNINSGYSWTTVCRNLMKYSPLETLRFLCCHGHEILTLPEEQGACNHVEECLPCSVCKRSTKDVSAFEYIPFRIRMREWLQTTDTFQMLFGFEDESSQNQSENYVDFRQGSCYRDIVSKRGKDETRYDLFIDVSMDGFNVFQSSSYDCWPIIVMLLNLPMHKRFLMGNVVPLGFIKGPREPKRLDSFLLPLIQEIRAINAENNGTGARFLCADGEMRCIQVHMMWCKGDGPAVQKVGGFVGARGKKMCRYCNIEGHLCLHCKTYYFPSKVRLQGDDDFDRTRMKRVYNPSHLPLRNRHEIVSVWTKLDDSSLTRTTKNRITTNTGIKPRTAIYDLDTISPFTSFPLDVMPLELNLTRSSLMPLWKGDERGILDDDDCPFVIDKIGWSSIDGEIDELRHGLPEAFFGRTMRNTEHYNCWKAEECRMFVTFYATILLQGHLSRRYLKGIRRSFANPTRTSKSWSNRVNVFIVVYVQRLDVNMWMFTFTVYVQGLHVLERKHSLFTATF